MAKNGKYVSEAVAKYLESHQVTPPPVQLNTKQLVALGAFLVNVNNMGVFEMLGYADRGGDSDAITAAKAVFEQAKALVNSIEKELGITPYLQ